MTGTTILAIDLGKYKCVSCTYDKVTAAAEFRVARRAASGFHLVMCHPGVPTRELAALDPITERRSLELAFLGRDNPITPRLWLPARSADGPVIDWRQERERMS